MSSIYDFTTWAPLARLLTVGNPEKLAIAGGFVVGSVDGRGSIYTGRVGDGSAAHRQAQWDAERLVSAALQVAGLSRLAYALRVSPTLDAGCR